MAKPYCVSQMLNTLAHMDIPNEWEQEFIWKCEYKKKDTFSVTQYNRVIILFNKYIAVPAAVPCYKHDGSNRA